MPTEIERRIIRPVTAALPGPDAELRARLISAQFMGLGLFAFGRLLDPDAPPPPPETVERAVELFGAAVQAVVTPPPALHGDEPLPA